MSARVVGLDLSVAATGVASPDGRTRTVKPLGTGDARLVEIVAQVAATTTGAALVVIEGFVVRTPAAAVLGMVHGAVRLTLIDQGVRYVVVPPATLKSFATGRGNAGKPEMAVALFKRAGLELADDNQVDAFWLRAAGLQLLGEPAFPLPAAQVAALDKVRDQLGGAQ